MLKKDNKLNLQHFYRLPVHRSILGKKTLASIDYIELIQIYAAENITLE
jgi:hypothetical protein